MKYSLAIFVFLITACSGIQTAQQRIADDTVVPAGYSLPKQVRYGFTVQNTSANVIHDAEFWAYAPVRQTTNQFVKKLNASYPFESQTDEYGNEILHFKFKEIPPYGAKIVTINAELMMATAPQTKAQAGATFLRAEPFIETDNREVIALAGSLKTELPIQTATKIYDWIVSNLKSETFIAEDRGALYALKNKYGDCTEFAYLFTALSRADAIPARAVGGYVYHDNAILKAADYHNWAEFYADNAWHIADPQKQHLMSKESDYIAMRIIKTDNAGPMQNSHRFHYAGAGITVTMN